MFSNPEFLKHSVKLLFNIDIILKSQFDFLFTFKNLMILILEQDLAERVELGEKSDDILMGFKLNFLKEKTGGLRESVKKLWVNCGVEW